MNKTVLFLLAILTSPISFAACNLGNVYEGIECYEAQLKKDKATMNKVYQNLIKSYDIENQKYLEQSQKAWLNYRDAQCKGLLANLAKDAQGAGAGLVILSCEADLTQHRLQELKQLKN